MMIWALLCVSLASLQVPTLSMNDNGVHPDALLTAAGYLACAVLSDDQ